MRRGQDYFVFIGFNNEDHQSIVLNATVNEVHAT